MYCKTGERFMKARTIYNKNGNQNKKEAAAGAGVTESILSNIENDDIDRDVGCSHVIALANYYGVTTDYLLGLSNAPTNDESVISAVSYTGLSVETVNKLKGITKAPSRKYFLEALIEDDEILKYLANYVCAYVPYEVQHSDYKYIPLKVPLRSGYRDMAFAAVIRALPLFAEKYEANNNDALDDLMIEYLRNCADVEQAKQKVNEYFGYEEYCITSEDDLPTEEDLNGYNPNDYDEYDILDLSECEIMESRLLEEKKIESIMMAIDKIEKETK